jgi:UDP-2-acetamido-3-amino-2,3-dideoxy-glucuronate N-acetyltransferase
MSSYYCHPTSIIEKNVKIGRNTNIWHFSHIDEGAIIGEYSNLGQNTYIGKNVKVGNYVKVQNNVSIYQGVQINDYVFCGPSVVFTNDLTPRSRFPKNSNQYTTTIVNAGATIGANSTIVCGVEIGFNAMIGAGSVVTKDVKPNQLVFGNPAKPRGWVCDCGVKLDDSLICKECKRKYVETNDGIIQE